MNLSMLLPFILTASLYPQVTAEAGSIDMQMITDYRKNELLVPVVTELPDANTSATPDSFDEPTVWLPVGLLIVRSRSCLSVTCKVAPLQMQPNTSSMFEYRLERRNLTLTKTLVFELSVGVPNGSHSQASPLDERIEVTCSSAADGSTRRSEYTIMGRNASYLLATKVICRAALRVNLLEMEAVEGHPGKASIGGICNVIRLFHDIMKQRQDTENMSGGCLTLLLLNTNYLLQMAHRYPSDCNKKQRLRLECSWDVFSELLGTMAQLRDPMRPTWATQYREAAEEFVALIEQFATGVSDAQISFANASIAFSVFNTSIGYQLNASSDDELTDGALTPTVERENYQEVRVRASDHVIQEVTLARAGGTPLQYLSAEDYVVLQLPAHMTRSGRWSLVILSDDLLYAKEFDNRIFNGNNGSESAQKEHIGSFTVDLKTELVSQVLPDPVYITFRKKPSCQGIKPYSRPTCVFWNVTTEEWSPDGCWIEDETASSVTCACNHLTAFSVLFVPLEQSADPEMNLHRRIMSNLTYVTSSLSMVCLVFMIVSYVLFLLAQRRSPHGQQSRDLTSSRVTLLMIVLLACQFLLFFANSLARNKPNWLCQAVASALHFTLLATSVCSNGLSTHIFLTIAVPIMWPNVFQCRVQRHYTKATMLVTIILSSLAVGLTFWSTVPQGRWPYRNYTEAHGNSAQHYSLCWLDRDLLIPAFLCPFGASLAYNFLLVVVSLASVFFRRSVSNAKAKGTLARRLHQVLGLTFLLGLTWILGIFAFLVNSETSPTLRLIFEYTFIVGNGSQGFCIFVFFFLGKKELVRVWRQTCCCCCRCFWQNTSSLAYKSSQSTYS